MHTLFAKSLLLSLAAVLAGCVGTAAIPPPPPCQGNCTTHTEGYEWAQRANLQDAKRCDGYPDSFSAGCRDGVEDMLQFWRTSREL